MLGLHIDISHAGCAAKLAAQQCCRVQSKQLLRPALILHACAGCQPCAR